VEQRVSYTIIGAFVIILSGMLVMGLLWLASGGWNRSYTEYAVYFKTGASILGRASQVFDHGVPVGQVASVSLDPKNPDRAMVLLDIVKGTPIKEDTRAVVTSRGVTGAGYVSLSGGTPASPPLTIKPGQPYPVIKTLPGAGGSLTESVHVVARKLIALTNRLDELLSNKNIRSVSESLENIHQLTANLAARASMIDHAVSGLDATLNNTRVATAKLPQLVHQLNLTLAGFRTAAARVATAANGIGTVARGLRGLTPGARALIVRLGRTAADLDALLQSLQHRPNALIFGKPARPGPGESKPSGG